MNDVIADNASRLAGLIRSDAEVRQIASGLMFTEGPVWHPTDGELIFSDIPADVRYRWSPTAGTREDRRPSMKSNGIVLDADGNLLICEHVSSRVVHETPDGAQRVLARHFEGVELNSPNDITVRSDGSIFFTDPWYGRMPGSGLERERALGWQGVFRIDPDGELHLLVDRDLFEMPNGLCFSPGETMLYVNDTERAVIRRFAVAADGSLNAGEVFATEVYSAGEPGVVDGMKCDAAGNVWVTGPGGVWIFAPTGERLGRIRVPEVTANLAWGGAEWRTLFITASTSVYAIDVEIGPRPEPYMS